MTQAAQNGFILIEFSEPGSSVFNVKMDGVNALQLASVATWLDITARADLLAIRDRQHIQIPKEPEKILRMSGQ